MAAPPDRIANLGSRATPEFASSEEWLSRFPIRLHPTPEMESFFVAKYIAEMPYEFEKLKLLMRQEKDLASVMSEFDRFLIRSGFDQKYSWSDVFGTLCEAARA